MRKLYTLGHSQCRLQSRAQVGASSPFTHCTRFVFLLLLLLGGVLHGVVGQTAQYNLNYPKVSNVNTNSVDVVTNLTIGSATTNTKFVIVKDDFPFSVEIEDVIEGSYWDPSVGDYVDFELKNSIPVTSRNSNKELSVAIIGLTPNTNYLVYLVTVLSNTSTIEQTSPTVLSFTTLSALNPPTLVSENALTPANGASGVSLSPKLSMTFNEAVVKPVGVSKFLTIRKSDGAFVNSYNIESSSIVISGNLVTIPTSGLDAGTDYYVTVDAGFVKSSTSGVDFGGIAGNTTWTFTTGSAPQLADIDPLLPININTVPLSPTLTMKFKEAVSRPDVNKYLRLYKVGETTNPIEVNATNTSLVAINGSEVSISVSGLEQGANYYVVVEPGFVKSSSSQIDFAGISEETTWIFSTGSAPQLVAENPLSPVNGATGVTLSPTLSMTFNENVVKSKVDRYLNIYKKDGTFITTYNVRSGSVVVEGSVVSIPVLGLAAGTEYYVTVDGGFVTSSTSGIDFSGFSANTAWTFTTGFAPHLVVENPLTPANGATAVQLDVNLTATFDVPVRFNTGSESKLISITDPSGSFINFVVANGVSSPAGVSIVGNVLTINPSNDFEFGTNYKVSFQAGILESEGGIPFDGINSDNWSFVTDAPIPLGTLETPTGSNISILTDVVVKYNVAIRNLDGTSINDSNLKSLINIYRGNVAPENIMPSSEYNATIAVDKKSFTIRLVPGSYYLPNTDVSVVIDKVENNQGIEQSEAQIFTFKTGQYNTWIGETSSDWVDPSNWASGYSQGSSVIIGSVSEGQFNPAIGVGVEIPNLIIGKGGKLTINSGINLSVTNDFRMYSVNDATASASLVINGSLTTVPSKTFIYQGITSYDYDYYISSPVTGAQKSVVAPAGSVFQYNPATDVYDPLSSGDLLIPGKGYGGYAPAGSSFSFSGSVNQASEYSLTCVRTSKNAGWNLAGNPYPCAINLASTYLGTGRFVGLKPHVYIRDNATFQLYAWNFSAETGTADGPEIPAMHSFWVQVATDQTTGTLVMNSSDRMHNTTNYHKSASATPVQKPTIKLFTQNGAVKDLSVITFISGNDDAYDDYDSEKRFSQNNLVADLYTIKEGKRLVINSFGEFSGSKEVPIGVYARKAGTYTLGIASLAGFDQEVELKLVDYGTSPATTHDLSSGDYSFTVAGNTYIDHRFVLQVSNKVATGVEQPEANREVTIYAFHSDVVIENKGDALGQYTIYDLSGRVLTSGEVGAFSKISVPMPVKGVVLGVVKTSKGMVNQKLLIQ